jgi:hypothetical protein
VLFGDLDRDREDGREGERWGDKIIILKRKLVSDAVARSFLREATRN